MIRNPFKPAKYLFAIATSFLLCLATRGQVIITSFPGVSSSEVFLTPPDTMGAAGTNQFVVFINGAFAVYNKAGVRQSLVTDTAFWLSAGIPQSALNAGVSEPRIAYDAASGRWIATELTAEATGNNVLLGRSDSSNPSGTWKAVKLTGNANQFWDFDTLGVDAQAIYVAVNNYANGTFNYTVSLLCIPKADFIAATPSITNVTSFRNLNANTYGVSLQGVSNPDTGPGHGVIVASDAVVANRFDRTTINGSGGAGATLSATTYIPITFDYPPNPATQPGGAKVDGGESDSFASAVCQIGGYVFIANGYLNTNKDAIHWIVINETNNTVTSEGLISDPGYNFTYPSIAATHSGKVLLGFNRIGTNAPAGDISTYAALGSVSHGIVTMGSPFLLKQGTVTNYHGMEGENNVSNRWGDYSATMFDPTDENLVWTIQEIPISTNAWSTVVSLISLATNRPTLNLTRSGNTVTISWPLSTDPAYVLQSSPVLPNSAWTNVGITPEVSINRRVVTLTVTGQALYLRLKK